MNSNAISQPKKKVTATKLLLSLVGAVITVAVIVFAASLLRGSMKASDAEAPRASVATSYNAIKLPAELKLSEHKSVTTGTPSEVYFYSFQANKLDVSNQFAASLKSAGYSVITGTDGLIFSASKEGAISLNFTFTDPNQLKVIAI